MFRMVVKLFDVLCLEWRSKLLAASSGGAQNMTGRLVGVVSRLSKAINPASELIRIWCGAHQLDLVMEHIMSEVVKERFFVVLTGFISHLTRQQNLIAKMGSSCPRLVNRWLSADKVTTWFKKKRPQLLQYIERKQPASAPPPLWWVYLLAME
jgi:hypothetical protein